MANLAGKNHNKIYSCNKHTIIFKLLAFSAL